MSIRKALAWSMAERYIVTIFGFVSVMVLSRLLKPAEVGVFSVSYSVVAMSQAIRDFGTTDYLVQEPELTRERIRTAFSLTMVMGFLMGAIVFLLARPAAILYHAPDVSGMLRILSLTFFLWPFGAPLMALLKREMRFDIHARINVLSGLAQPVVSITLVWMGYSYWGLAWGVIAGVVCTVFFSGLYRARDTWMTPSFSEWRRVIGFGTRALATSLIGAIGNYASDLIIGRMVGISGAGLYSRAASLSRMLFTQVWGAASVVALPEFARRAREGENVSNAMLGTITLVTGIGWPILCVLLICTRSTIRVLFGPHWDTCIPLTQILAIGGLIETVGLPVWSVLIATGNISRALTFNTVTQPLRVIGYIVGGYFGLIPVAIVQTVMSYLTFFLWARLCRQAIGLRGTQIFPATRSSAAVTAATIVVVLPVKLLLVHFRFGDGAILFGVSMSATLGWVAGIYGINHPLRPEADHIFGLIFRGVSRAYRKS